MTRVIAIANQKGGCGKTTTTINLGSVLAERGQRVLIVDLDPQSHLSLGLNVNPMQIKRSVYDILLQHELNPRDAITNVRANLDLVPSTLDLASAEIDMNSVLNKENRLNRAFRALRDEYDYILLDCPPALGILTINALCAADEVLVVIETSYFALHGVARLLKVVSAIADEYGNDYVVRALATLYDQRNNLDRDVLSEIRKQFGERALRSIIRRNVRLKEAASAGSYIGDYDRNSPGFADYLALCDELLALHGAAPAAAVPADAAVVAQAAAVAEAAAEEAVDAPVAVNSSTSSTGM